LVDSITSFALCAVYIEKVYARFRFAAAFTDCLPPSTRPFCRFTAFTAVLGLRSVYCVWFTFKRILAGPFVALRSTCVAFTDSALRSAVHWICHPPVAFVNSLFLVTLVVTRSVALQFYALRLVSHVLRFTAFYIALFAVTRSRLPFGLRYTLRLRWVTFTVPDLFALRFV